MLISQPHCNFSRLDTDWEAMGLNPDNKNNVGGGLWHS